MQNKKTIPSEPPVNLPKCKDIALGTTSAAVVELDNKLASKEEQIRVNATKEKDGLESEGFGEIVAEVQQITWPIERIFSGEEFLIHMCFHCTDGTLQWYRGHIESVVHDKSERKNAIEVMIRWNEEHIDEGQLNPTNQLLRKASRNNTTHVNGT